MNVWLEKWCFESDSVFDIYLPKVLTGVYFIHLPNSFEKL